MERNCESCRYNVNGEFDLKRCKKCSRTERAFFEPIPNQEQTEENAATIMEQLIQDGTYADIKMFDAQLNSIKKELYERLKDSENRRHEFKKHNVVAKFVPKKVSEIDSEGLIDNLFCYLQAPMVCQALKLNVSKLKNEDPELLKDLLVFKQEESYYVKPSFNKKGKEIINQNIKEQPLSDWSITQLIGKFNPIYERKENVTNIYESCKKKMLSCHILRKSYEEGKPLKHEFGSVSLVANNPTFDMDSIYKQLGEEFIIKYALPDNTKLDHYVSKRIINKSEIERYKKIIDIRLDFIVMPLDVERRIMSQFQQRAIQQSLSLFG